ncbi:MAG TPA: hypothetical protein DCW88_10460 [Agrobacterium sp.]|nr:hypothetical protein [Agrobacterium sp.]
MAVFAAIVGFLYIISKVATEITTPPCERLASQLLDVAKDQTNPFFRTIDFVDLKLSKEDGDNVQCSAIAMLSNGMKMNVNLSQYSEYGKLWVKSEPQGLPY